MVQSGWNPYPASPLRRQVWAICLCQYCQSWGMYGLLNWLPTFFRDSYGVEVKDLGGYTLLPYVVQGLLGVVSGYAADALITRWVPAGAGQGAGGLVGV